MNSYRYFNNQYYIDVTSQLRRENVDDEDFHEYRKVLINRIEDFSLKDDPNTDKGNVYLGVIHELTHYYQDLIFPSCIGEHLYKTWFYRYYIDKHTGHSPSLIIDKDDTELFNYIFKKPISIDFASALNDPITKCGLKFINEFQIFDTISYVDLYESYAELKAWQHLINESNPTENNMKYIRKLLQDKNPQLQINSKGEYVVEINYNVDFLKYTVARNYFLLYFIQFFQYRKINNAIPNTIYDQQYLMILMNMGIGVGSIIQRYDKNRYNNSQHAEDTYYLKYCEANLLNWVLLVLDIAFSIPSIKTIRYLIDNKNYKKEDFHPCCRFYKIMHTLIIHHDTIINMDEKCKWVDFFDFIASKNGWLSYYDTAKDLAMNNSLQHNGYIPIYQEHLLTLRQYITIEENNVSMLSLFQNHRIPIVLHFKNYYVVIQMQNGIIHENIVGDFTKELMNYMNPDYLEQTKHKDCDIGSFPAAESFGHKTSMTLYKFLSQAKPFKCFCSWCKNFNNCNVNKISDIFKNEDRCFLMTHIKIENMFFLQKIQSLNIK